MTKLEQLIQELCPKGVKFVKFQDVCTYTRGITYNKSKEATPNNISPWKVFRANNITLSNNTLNFDDIKLVKKEVKVKPEQILKIGDILICAGSGSKEHIGKVAYITEDMDYTFGGFMAVIRCCQTLNSRFLFHILTSTAFSDYLASALNSATINNLNYSVISNFTFPLPPLEVQREIVRVLDTFTELTAELTAELTVRKKQYEYYRENLFNFSTDIPCVELSTVIKSLNTGLNPRQFFNLNTDDATNYYVTIREIQNNTITVSQKTDRINNEALKLCNNRSNLEVGDVLFSGTGTIGETAVIDNPPVNWNIKEGVYAIKPIQNKLNSKFLMYLLQTAKMKTAIMKKVAGGTVKSIPMSEMKKLIIPLPTLDIQKNIVAHLDNFSAICNSLTTGLPAEIEARKKQYEYYRDKLLSF